MSSQDSISNQFLGTGIAYPLCISGGLLTTNSLEEHVKQSILIILKTEKNERPMLPDFGAGLGRYVFSGMNSASILMIKRSVYEALGKYEPRIELLNVDVIADSDQACIMNIIIEYRMKANDSVYNLVYPYYAGRGRGDV